MDPLEGRAVVVFAGGLAPSPHAVARLPRGAHVIAADSGYDHARARGSTSISSSAISTRSRRAGSKRRRPRASRSSCTRLRRTRPTSPSRCSRRVTSARRRSPSSRGTADGSTTCSPASSRSPIPARRRADRRVDRQRVGAAAARPRPRSRPGEAGEVVTLAALAGVAKGVRTDGAHATPSAARPSSPARPGVSATSSTGRRQRCGWRKGRC